MNLDPRVEKFVTKTLYLPADMETDEWLRDNGVKRAIYDDIYHLNEWMVRQTKALEQIKSEAAKALSSQEEGYWPSELIGGGTWFTEDVRRYDEAVAEVTRHREALVTLVTLARIEKIIPLVETGETV